MVKQRMGSADVAGECACLRKQLLGLRVANLYDLNPKTYMLKLSKSGEEGEKVFLVLESGTRFHTTQYQKEKSNTPSNFTLKLRKHLRARRLEDVRQLGVDRIVDFQFGSGEAAYHLILELYSQGNVILTDASYEVLTLLRSHRDDAKGFAIMARHPYPIHTIRQRQAVTEEQLEAALSSADEKQTLRGALSSALPYGPAVADHCLLIAGLPPLQKDSATVGTARSAAVVRCEQEAVPGFITYRMAGDVKKSRKQLAREAEAGPAAKGSVVPVPAPDSHALETHSQPAAAANSGGSPMAQHADGSAAPAADAKPQDALPEGASYEEYDPLLLKQNEGLGYLEFPTYDAALDEFFAKIEGQQAASRQAQQEKAALSKLEKLQLDQGRRAEDLEKNAAEAEEKAAMLEYNLEAADAAIQAVREALASGLDWRELGQMIKAERRAGNPVAGLIESLQLERNSITLLLANYYDDQEGDDDEAALTRPATKVEVDLDQNAYANARLHYGKRKQHLIKQQKTLDANEKAFQAAEKKAQAQLSQVRTATAAQHLRKSHWFEKFNWFVTSENYLVISGRDAQQNELVVKRYMRKGDLYVHADLHGAASTIIKNSDASKPAGAACVCRSAAWDAKVVTSAWWVYDHQVSKTAPTGEYLTVGSFMVRGKKNFLPPNRLEMGLTFLFKLEESCLAGHLGERAPRTVDEDGSTIFGDAAAADVGTEEVAEAESGSEASSHSGDRAASSAGNFTSEGTRWSNSALAAFMEGSADTLRRGASQSYAKYGLETAESPAAAADQEGSEAAEAQASQNGGGSGRRHLSAKERKLLKKGQGAVGTLHPDPSANGHLSSESQQSAPPEVDEAADNTASGEAAAEGDGQHSSETALMAARKAEQERRQHKQEARLESAAAQSSARANKGKPGIAKAAPAQALQSQQAPAQQQPVRGKAAKTKKLKHYEDQDEDDRQLAMQLLASAGPQKSKEQRKQERKARLDAERGGGGADALLSSMQKPTADDLEAVGAARPSRAAQERADQRLRAKAQASAANGEQASSPPTPEEPEAAEAEPGDEPSQMPTGTTSAEQAEIRQLLAEENVEVLTEEDRDRLTQLDSLTGVPRGNDVLLFALPMCAPYQALQGYKYRLKLTPGSQRKGKAARQAVELLTRQHDANAREKELMKAVPENDTITAVISSVKISMPGLSKLKTQQRKSKKG
eukprot:jgi/Astpho2/5087/fgenesh1_pg.00072_%23_10_t